MAPIKGFRQISPDDIEFAAGLLGQGEPIDTVRAKLGDRGLTQANVDAVIEQVYVRQVYADAAGMLQQGQPPEQVKQALVARGLSPENASTVVENLLNPEGSGGSGGTPVRQIIGGIIVVVGIGLWIGNMTGVFPTFPFAGILTIIVGSVIAGSGQK